MKTRNARFWIWWNQGWVKLTLTRRRPIIQLLMGRQTEEGYTQEYQVYRLMVDGVECETHVYSSDCDGPHEWHWEGRCAFDRLREPTDPDLIVDPEDPCDRPMWERTHVSQRDVYAEMAGY